MKKEKHKNNESFEKHKYQSFAAFKEETKLQETEREKFYSLFNIFVHEIKHVNPELFPSCLEIEAMMNEAFGDKEKQTCI